MRISDWSSDVCSSDLTPLPPTDENCVAVVSALQDEIADHVPIDIDEDWSDVDVDLPDVRKRRRSVLDIENFESVRRLLLSGLRDGYVCRRPLAAERIGQFEHRDAEFERDLELVLGDLVIALIDADWAWSTKRSEEQTPERQHIMRLSYDVSRL